MQYSPPTKEGAEGGKENQRNLEVNRANVEKLRINSFHIEPEENMKGENAQSEKACIDRDSKKWHGLLLRKRDHFQEENFEVGESIPENF